MINPPPFGTILAGKMFTVMSLGTKDPHQSLRVLILARSAGWQGTEIWVGRVAAVHPEWVADALIVENGPEPRTTA